MTSPLEGAEPIDPSDLSASGTLATPSITATARVRPSGWWFLVGAAIVVIGIGVGIAMIVGAVQSSLQAVDDYARVPVPGTEVVTLEEGQLTIYAEYRSSGYWYGGPDPYVRIYEARTGDELTWYPTYSSSTYELGGRHGMSIGTVDVPADGRYEVVVEEGTSSASAVAIGEEVAFGAVAGVFGGIGVAALGVLIGTVAMIVVGVRRGRAKRAQRPTTPVGWRPPPGGGWAQPVQPGWAPPTQPGWGPPTQPGWAPPTQPGWGPPTQPGWGPPSGGPTPSASPPGWPAPGAGGAPSGWAPPPPAPPATTPPSTGPQPPVGPPPSSAPTWAPPAPGAPPTADGAGWAAPRPRGTTDAATPPARGPGDPPG